MNLVKKCFYLLSLLCFSTLTLAQDATDVWGMGPKVIGTITSVNVGSINFEGRKLYIDAATRIENGLGNIMSSSDMAKGDTAIIQLRETTNKIQNYIDSIRVYKK